MLKPNYRNGKYFYSILHHPVSRCLKFKKFNQYLSSLSSGGIVLDYGSGDQPYKEMLLSTFEKYIAADYPVTNMHHHKKPDVEIFPNSKLSIDDNSIDCVVLTEVLEHLYNPKDVLTELKRILKPGGILIGTVPFFMSEHEQPYDYHRYTFFCLEKMFQDAGYKITRLEYIGDLIGVFLRSWEMLVALPIKLFRKLKLNWLGFLFSLIFRIPVLIYFFALNMNLNPTKIKYLKTYPLGFTFYLEKPK